MSVVRLGGRGSYSPDPRSGKAAWVALLTEQLDALEETAAQQGAEVDWESLEFDTETDYLDDSTLTGNVVERRIVTLRTTALGLTSASRTNFRTTPGRQK